MNNNNNPETNLDNPNGNELAEINNTENIFINI